MSKHELAQEFELFDWQRAKLLGFIEQFERCYSDGAFDPGEDWNDPHLIGLALRVAQLLGFESAQLEQFFEREFEIAGVTDDDLGTMLALAMRADIENRIRCAAGGRN